jgi:hypothetical protein
MEMVIKTTGVLLEMNAAWGPYYKIYADEYTCPGCGDSVFLPAEKVLVEHFEPNYKNLANAVQIDFADTH